MREAERNHLGKLMYYCRKNYSWNCRANEPPFSCPHRKLCIKLHNELMKHEPYKTEAYELEVKDAKKNCKECGYFDETKTSFYKCCVKGVCPVFKRVKDIVDTFKQVKQ